jgi:hypothetical protein
LLALQKALNSAWQRKSSNFLLAALNEIMP